MLKPKIPIQKGNTSKITSSGKGTIQNKVLSSKGPFDKTTDVNNVDLVQADSPAIQRKSSPNWSYQLKSITQHSNHPSPLQRVAVSPNKTGLPDNLKSGIESLSGMSMDHVKVHYNSPKPAQLQAHAYAQGADIHVASGQEKHVPHEAWHVVQQAQGRVRPTTQLKQSVPINDEVSLENEADLMGVKAVQMISNGKSQQTISKNTSSDTAIQLVKWRLVSHGQYEKVPDGTDDALEAIPAGSKEVESTNPIEQASSEVQAPAVAAAVEEVSSAGALTEAVENSSVEDQTAAIAQAPAAVDSSIPESQAHADNKTPKEYQQSYAQKSILGGFSLAGKAAGAIGSIKSGLFGDKDKDGNVKKDAEGKESSGLFGSLWKNFGFGKGGAGSADKDSQGGAMGAVGKKTGSALGGISNFLFGNKDSKDEMSKDGAMSTIGKKTGSALGGISNFLFGDKNAKDEKEKDGAMGSIVKKTGSALGGIKNFLFGNKDAKDKKSQDGLMGTIGGGVKSGLGKAQDLMNWGDEDLKKDGWWNQVKGRGKQVIGGIGGVGLGALSLGAGLVAGTVAGAGGLVAGATAVGAGLAAGTVAGAGGLAAGATAVGAGLAAGTVAGAGALAAGATVAGTGLAAGALVGAGGLALGATAAGVGAAGATIAGAGALTAGALGAVGGGLLYGGKMAKDVINRPNKNKGASHAKYGDNWNEIDKKHHTAMKTSDDHTFSEQVLPKGFHMDGRHDYGATGNKTKATYASQTVGGILGGTNSLLKDSGVASSVTNDMGISTGVFGGIGGLITAYQDAKEGLGNGTDNSTKVKKGADVVADLASGTSTFSSIMSNASNAANYSGLFSMITGSIDILRGFIGGVNAYNRKNTSNELLKKTLKGINEKNKIEQSTFFAEDDIEKWVNSGDETAKENIAILLKGYKGDHEQDLHQIADIADQVKDTQNRNMVSAGGLMAKGAIAVAGGAVLFVLGSNPIGWALLGTAAVVGIGMLIYNAIQKGKSKKQIAIKELDVDEKAQKEWDDHEDKYTGFTFSALKNTVMNPDETSEKLNKKGASPLSEKLDEHNFMDVDHFYSNYINATAHKIQHEAYLNKDEAYIEIVKSLGFKGPKDIGDDPSKYPTPKQIAKQLNA